MEIPTDSTLSPQISFQRGSICTPPLLIKPPETNWQEVPPGTAPKLKPTVGRVPTPGARTAPRHREDESPLTYLTRQH